MKIDLGNFGQSTIEVAPQARTDVVGNAVEQAGGQIEQVGRQMAEQRFQQQAGTAANNLLDHQLQDQENLSSVKERLASGELAPEQAQAEYQKLAQANTLPRVDHLTPEAADAYTRGAKRVQAETGFKVDTLANAARLQRSQDEFDQGLEKLRKLAGSPGMSNEQTQALIDQSKTFGPRARAAHIPQDMIDKALDSFADQTWLDTATQRFIENNDNMAGLQSLQKDLTEKNGFYDGKLNANKRNSVESQVTNRMDTLANRLQHEADKRDADGERAINEINRQIATGVQAPPNQWAIWAQRTNGTSFAPDFADAIQHEQKVQEVLRLPVDQQITYLQKEQAVIDSHGATVKEQTNHFGLANAVRANVMQMQQAPLLWMQNRLGKSTELLDITQLLSPDGAKVLHDQISQRVLDIKTMQKQQGAQIGMIPLLPQDVAQFSGMLEAATPDQSTAMFQGLRNLTEDDGVFAAIVQQIAPDHPVKAVAGQISVVDPRTASLILEGDAALNPNKAAAAKDGKPDVKLYAPSQSVFQKAFTDKVGTIFRNSFSGAAENSMQAAMAYYIGMARRTGKLLNDPNLPDTDLMNEAIDKVVGTVVDYNGKGDVAAPWGMDQSTFMTRVDNAYAVAVKKYHFDMTGAQLAQIGLQNTGVEGQYFMAVPGQNPANPADKSHPPFLTVIQGGRAVPVIIDLNDPLSINPPAKSERVFVNPRTGQKATIQ